MTDEEQQALLGEREERRQPIDALYERINCLWRQSDLPTEILKTPGWQAGWRRLWDWYFGRARWPEPPFERPPCDPGGRPATWQQRIHIWSHYLDPIGTHGLDHAIIEEEAQRLILEWWHEEKGR